MYALLILSSLIGENWGMQIIVSIYRIPNRNSRKLKGFYILYESNRKISPSFAHPIKQYGQILKQSQS